MTVVLVLLLLVLVFATVLFGVLRALTRTWLDYRLRLSLLDKLEHASLSNKTPEEVERVLETAIPPIEAMPRQDYAITGLLLAAVGLAMFMVGSSLRVGQLAMGTYYGGATCILLGVLLALAGFIIRVLRRASESQ